MTTEVTRNTVDDSLEVRTTFTSADIDLYGRNVMSAAQGAASQALADKFIAERGQEIISKIPLESVLNQTIALVVLKIGGAAAERR